MPRHETHIAIDEAKFLAELNRRGLSAAEFSVIAGISPGTISGLVSRGRPVSVRTARRIAKALVETPPLEGLEGLLRESAAAA